MVALAGCGTSADDLEQAREQGAAEARAEQQEKTNADLRKDIERLEGRGDDIPPGSGGTSAPAAGEDASAGRGAGAGSSGALARVCGSGVTVSAATTCDFAEVVVTSYYEGGEPSSLQAYSPVTQRTYTMSCSGSDPVTCTGGSGAAVRFP